MSSETTTTDLQIEVEQPEAWSRRLSITVPRERVQRVRSAVTEQLTRNARLPGFRKGKLPPRIVQQKFGPEIEQETLDRVIQESYREALQSQDFQPITQGMIDNVEYEPQSDLRFEVRFEVRPQLDLARTGGFSATRPPAEIGDDEVESVFERLRDERGTWNPLPDGERPDYGDQVTVEILGQELEEEGEEPQARTYRFELGEGQAIPMVEESIMTLLAGEEGDFAVRFPDDFADEEQRGREQQLHIRLVDGKRKELPSVDDDFAREVGDFDSLDALRTRIREDLEEEARRRSEGEIRAQLIGQIVEANPFEIPNSMTERYLDHMTGQGEERERPRDLTPAQADRLAQFRETLRPQAETHLKRILIVEHIAEHEDLRATQDEIDERVEEIARKHDRQPADVWLTLEKSGQLQVLENEITEDRVFEYLKNQSTVA